MAVFATQGASSVESGSATNAAQEAEGEEQEAMSRVVIWDPRGDFKLGEIVGGVEAERLVVQRAATLPIEADLLSRNGLSGWNMRAFGKGERFDPVTHKRGCAVAIYIASGFSKINWVASVIPAGPNPRGQLRMSADTSQVNINTGGLRPDNQPTRIEALSGQLDGRWLIGGEATLVARVEGFMGLGLYGTASDCAVEWIAVSQTK